MIIKWIKKHRAMTVLLFIFLYLVIGAAAPFYHYKPVSGITKANTSASAFYQDGPGCDRAMILETNQSAWDERMRLMSLAKERIILSTFDFRDGESPRAVSYTHLSSLKQCFKSSAVPPCAPYPGTRKYVCGISLRRILPISG